MKKVIPLFFIVLFLSCGENKQKPSSDSAWSNCTDSGRIFSPSLPTDAKDPVLITTDYVFDFKVKIPPGFYFDTLTVRDSINKAVYTLYCLQSSSSQMKKFNSTIKNELLKNVNKEIGTSEMIYENIPVDPLYTYELGPYELFMDEKMLSLCCIIDTYGWGGNHHNYSWYTFNYDLKKNKIIRFEDVFKLKSSSDSIEFARLANRQMDDVYRSDWSSPLEPVDFSFVKKGICINPELSWANSMQRAFLPRDSLKGFMINNY
jgi:hypothetical protein